MKSQEFVFKLKTREALKLIHLHSIYLISNTLVVNATLQSLGSLNYLKNPLGQGPLDPILFHIFTSKAIVSNYPLLKCRWPGG